MGWAVGYDEHWRRDVGYGVPALCDHPGCGAHIDRGLSYVCGGQPYGGEHGCGLFFCARHRHLAEEGELCIRCFDGEDPFEPTPDVLEWSQHKLTDESWREWRALHPEEVAKLLAGQ
jgi:hypothetical protein